VLTGTWYVHVTVRFWVPVTVPEAHQAQFSLMQVRHLFLQLIEFEWLITGESVHVCIGYQGRRDVAAWMCVCVGRPVPAGANSKLLGLHPCHKPLVG
jgi:hypothetical protein